MALTLSVGERPAGGGILSDSTLLVQQAASYGAGVLPELSLALENGTGANQANIWYLAKRTLAATTYDLLDLAGGLTAFNGSTITFTKIKRVLVAIDSPDGTKRVRVGPQDQSNPWPGPWGGTGPTVYADVLWKFDVVNPFAAGWAVTAGTGDVFPVYNPGGSSVDYIIWLLGVQ